MATRNRSRIESVYGRYYNIGSPPGSYRVSTDLDERCTDVIGNYGGENYLNLDKYKKVPFVLNGQSKSKVFEDWHPHSFTAPSHLGSWGPGWDADGTTVAARTNPSRPHVSLPVFIKELPEIPSLIRFAGKSALRFAAGENLKWQFGILPLVSDLLKLTQFHDIFDKRMREIEKLKQGGLKRVISLSADSPTTAMSASRTTLLSVPAGVSIGGYAQTSTQRTKTGHIRWKPSTSTIKMDRATNRWLRRHLLGLDRSHMSLNIWNALPWSWLIDWCANVGDYLQATNNSIAYPAGPVTLVIHTVTTKRWLNPSGWPEGTNISPGVPEISTDSKARRIVYPSLTASLPCLSGKQMSILGSLAILKGRR